MEQLPANRNSQQDAAPSQQWAGVLPWLILGIWFLIQFCLYYQYLHREILWAFPGFWDQVRYLQESHDTYQYIVHHGLLSGLIHAFTAPTPTGNLLCTEAAVLYLFLGGSRLTALLVLFGHWIVLQTVAVVTLRWLSKRWSVTVMGLALLLLPTSPFRTEGSLSTFQIDFAAYCTFGVWICLVIRSNVFANRRLSLLASLIACYLILLRFITMVYLGVIGSIFLVAVILLWLVQRRQETVSSHAKERIVNLLLVGGLILAVCLPVFWHNRIVIHQYYVVGHVTGQEKYIRAREAGVGNKLESILYYPRSVWTEHAGCYFRRAAGALILLTLLAIVIRRKSDNTVGFLPVSDRLDVPKAYLFLSACLVAPYLILTSDISKSPVVGNILIPPLWAMIVLGVVWATDRLQTRMVYALTGAAAMLYSVAFCFQVSSFNRQGRFTLQRADVEQVLELDDLIGQKSLELGLTNPTIGTDHLDDFFFPAAVGVTEWERHQMLLAPRPAYPQGIFAVDEKETIADLHTANFVLLTLSGGLESSAFLFNKSMEPLHGKMLEICEHEMLPIREASLFGRYVRLYMRPTVRVETHFPDWITEDDLVVHGTTGLLRRFPRITLRGQTFPNFHFPKDDHNVSATLEMENQPSVPVPATLIETNGQYILQLLVPATETSHDSPVTIRCHFLRYFVPKELGLNDDQRHLVVRPPDSVSLDRPTGD